LEAYINLLQKTSNNARIKENKKIKKGVDNMNTEKTIVQVAIEDIIPNRFQPRLTFDDKGLEDLANSIKQHGIIQPLVLRRISDKYEIIAGERRYKAATIAGLKTVPAIIAEMSDNESAEVAIVENVQRRDLTAIEEARSYKNLLDKGYLTQGELAKKMGLSQSAIANKLRLLNLDEEVQKALLNNEISERHARSLLVLETPEEQREWLHKVIDKRMTVRELDDALKKETTSDVPEKELTPKIEEPDIPLVKSMDIEDIKKQATELPDINADSDIARKLHEIEQEQKFNPDIIPIDQAKNEAKGSFFNFLENEKVNMNTEEAEVKVPVLNFDLPSEKEEQKEEINDSNEPVYEAKNTEEPKKEFAMPKLHENFGAPSVAIPDNDNDEIFDPIDLIETLEPDYEEKIEQQLGLDLKTAINTIRSAKDSLSEKGFNISLEETDLSDSYQFIIKVKKD